MKMGPAVDTASGKEQPQFIPDRSARAIEVGLMPGAVRRSEPIVGIDLGTTYSVVAALDSAGRPQTIPNRQGDLLTPSVVLFEDDGVIVGTEAQRLALVEPDRVAECAKRDMGSRYYHRSVAGRRVPPQVISALILKRLKADAERRLGPIRR